MPDWTEIDLSTAVFLGPPYGKYEDGHIVTNTGWPDFYFPDLVLNRTTDYLFEVTYDPDDPRDFGDRGFWVGAARDDDPVDSYDTDYMWDALFDSDVAEFELTDVYTFAITPGTWTDSAIPEGFNTPIFESERDGALLRLRYQGELAVVVPVTSYKLAGRSAFAS